MKLRIFSLFLLLLLSPLIASAHDFEAVNADGTIDATDISLVINLILGE